MGCGACANKQSTNVLPSVSMPSVVPSLYAQLRSQMPPQDVSRLLREWTKAKQLHQDSIKQYALSDTTDFLTKLSLGPPIEYRWEAWKAAFDLPTDISANYQIWLQASISPQVLADIGKDVYRTFPDFDYFKGAGAASLSNLLRAVSASDPEVGYCQGMNCVLALLLIVANGNEAEAFAVYQSASKKYHWRDLYLPGFPKMWELTFQWQAVFKEKDAAAYRGFKEVGLKEALWFTKAVLTLFAASLPLSLAVRVWDVLLAQGETVILRTVWAIVETIKRDMLGLELAEAATLLRDLPQRNFPAESFLKQIRQETVSNAALAKGTARYQTRKARLNS